MRRLYWIFLLTMTVPAYAGSDQPASPSHAHVEDSALLGLAGASGWNPESLPAPEELFPNGLPNSLAPAAMADTPSPWTRPEGPRRTLPTGFDVSHGALQFDLGTNVKTNGPPAPQSVVPTIPNPNVLGGAAGGAGEVKGEVRYKTGAWELYGRHTVSATQADGASPALHDRSIFGSTYKLPEWMAGGKLGTRLEVSPSNNGNGKTSVEYRQPLGGAEGYFSAERTFTPSQPEQDAAKSIRGGLIRKF